MEGTVTQETNVVPVTKTVEKEMDAEPNLRQSSTKEEPTQGNATAVVDEQPSSTITESTKIPHVAQVEDNEPPAEQTPTESLDLSAAEEKKEPEIIPEADQPKEREEVIAMESLTPDNATDVESPEEQAPTDTHEKDADDSTKENDETNAKKFSTKEDCNGTPPVVEAAGSGVSCSKSRNVVVGVLLFLLCGGLLLYFLAFNNTDTDSTPSLLTGTNAASSSDPLSPIFSPTSPTMTVSSNRPTSTSRPTSSPTRAPTKTPTKSPTITPSISGVPTITDAPTKTPSSQPSGRPTVSEAPTKMPTSQPSIRPTVSASPSDEPSSRPSSRPTMRPSGEPSKQPTGQPSKFPTVSDAPSNGPTNRPSARPTLSDAPTNEPTPQPSMRPTRTPTDAPSNEPTSPPSTRPTLSDAPTNEPTPQPTMRPTRTPSDRPSVSQLPTKSPTKSPTRFPTASPTNPPTRPPTNPPTNPPTRPPTNPPTRPPTEAFEVQLRSYLENDAGIRIDDSNNANQAITQIVEEARADGIDGELSLTPKLVQRYAMINMELALFGSSTGRQNQRNWGRFNQDECSWSGISCNGNREVTRIDMSDKGLQGSIPSEVGLLQALKYLALASNNLRGSLPEELYNAVSLEKIFLYQNRLSGTISDKIINLWSLAEFNLSSNQLSGPIPSTMRSGDRGVYRIRQFRVYDNQMTGRIPDGANLRQLQHFDLGRNRFSGTIPTSLATESVRLRYLYLDHNQFGGTLPSNIVNAGDGRVQILTVNDNQFTGTLPGWHLFITEMVQFTAQNNRFATMSQRTCRLNVMSTGEMPEFKSDCDVCVCGEKDQMCKHCYT